jgi:HK97 gp10 family phage protein
MIEAKGIQQVQQALKELDDKVSRSILRKGLRQGAKVVLAAAKADAPERTGRLKRNLKVRNKKGGKGKAALSVGAAAKDFTGEAFYSSFIEYGYSTRPSVTGKNAIRKKIPGQHFLKKAFEQTGEQAISTTIESWQQQIEDATQGAK